MSGYYCDYEEYDFGYEREPFDVDTTWRTFEDGEEMYEVQVYTETFQIRAGTYSSRASDPDEYYGEYESNYEILDVLYYADEDSEGVEIQPNELPKDILDEIDAEFGG